MKTLSFTAVAVTIIFVIFQKSLAIKLIVLTGDRGHGKTDTIRNMAKLLKDERIPVAGFYSRPHVRKYNKGTGVEVVNIITQDNAPFAMWTYYYTAHRKRLQFGQYIIETAAFDHVVQPIFQNVSNSDVRHVILMDEFGRYECASTKFMESLQYLFKRDCHIVVGTSTSRRMALYLLGNITKESEIFFAPIKRGNRTTTAALITKKLVGMYTELEKRL